MNLKKTVVTAVIAVCVVVGLNQKVDAQNAPKDVLATVSATEYGTDLKPRPDARVQPLPYLGKVNHIATPLGVVWTVTKVESTTRLVDIVKNELVWVEADSKTGLLHVYYPFVRGLSVGIEYTSDGKKYSNGITPSVPEAQRRGVPFTGRFELGGMRGVIFNDLPTTHPFTIKENENFDIFYQGIHFTFQDMKKILQEKGNKSTTPEDKKVVTNSPLVTKNQFGKSFLLTTVKSWWIDQMRQQGLFWVQKIGTKDPVFHLYFPAIGGGNMTVYYNGHYYTQKCGSDIADVDGNVTFVDFPLKGMPANYFKIHDKLNLEYYIGNSPSEDWDLFIK